LPLERRVAIAEVARRHHLQIVENDIYGTILDDPLPPIQAIAPERTHYLTSLGRIAGPGMKVGCLISPADQTSKTQAGVGASTGTSTLLTVELATAMIETGDLAAMADWQREENARRIALVGRFEHLATGRLHPASPHLWLPLPDRWRAEDFVEAAARRKVVIAPTHGFMADRGSIPHAVRLCIGAPKDLSSLEAACGRLDRLMGSVPRSSVDAA
jgi:DNA-binding transcriptional MocR family regulator